MLASIFLSIISKELCRPIQVLRYVAQLADKATFDTFISLPLLAVILQLHDVTKNLTLTLMMLLKRDIYEP